TPVARSSRPISPALSVNQMALSGPATRLETVMLPDATGYCAITAPVAGFTRPRTLPPDTRDSLYQMSPSSPTAIALTVPAGFATGPPTPPGESNGRPPSPSTPNPDRRHLRRVARVVSPRP